MKPFDGNEYRKRVMARLLDDFSLADPRTGDPFLVCDVDPAADATAAASRLDTVVAFWQKDRNHPKYKGVTAQLVARRADYAAVLTDPAARAEAAARVNGARAQTDADVIAQLDKLAATLLKRHQGIPRSRVVTLSAIAAADGMSSEAFTQWLAQHRVVEDVDPDGVAPWEASVRRQVRTALDELARIDPAVGARCSTLLSFLGLGTSASPHDIAAAHARLTAANRARPRDRVMTLTEDLLAHVSTRLLIDGGVAAYVASLRADARDSVKADLRRLAVLTGSLPAAEMEALSARIVGLGWGFTAGEARDLVRSAAQEMHLAVEVGGEVDLIVCPSCHRPQTVGRRKTCAYCRAHLYTDCPVCATTVPAASDVCPACSAPIAAWRAAVAAAPAAQEALDAGRVVEAAQIATQALAGIDEAAAPPPLRAAAGVAADQLARAKQTWADLRRDLGRGALWAASASATWLARNAVDCPDPTPPVPGAGTGTEGLPRDAAAMRDLITSRQAAVSADATRAASLAPQEAEHALGELLRRHPDCPEALAALAALPLPAPAAVTVTMRDGVASLTWDPAPGAPRSARYRIARRVTWPAVHADHTVVGTTSTAHLEDASAPAGTLVAYSVRAVDGSRSSAPVDTGEPVFVARDVEVLHAEVADEAVVLTWPTTGLGAAELVLEREVDPASGLNVPTRRIRPAESGRFVDTDIHFDVPYTYRLSLSYHTPAAELVRTEGRTATVQLRHPPRPVADLWASTDEAGRTTVSFQSPPAGCVRVYAAVNGTEPLAGFAAGSLDDLERAAGHCRLVGEGRRRVVDTQGRGAVTYRAVTVVDDAALAGATLTHMAVAKPAGLRVLADDRARVRVTFELPVGVTEAFVCWRRDRYPSSATETAPAAAGAGAAKVTNTKLQIDGGFTIEAPDDGRPLFVSVYPALRTGTGAPVAAAVAATLQARSATEVEVGYQVRVAGLLRKRLEVTVTCAPDGVLPRLRLVGRHAEPDHPRVGTALAEHPGGGTSAVLRVEDSAWPDGGFTVRLFALPEPGAVVRVVDPPADTRRVCH